MAKEGRDSKGRFVKGNTIGISTELARERQLQAAEARKENRLIASALQRALLRQDKQTGNPAIDNIVEGVVERVQKTGGTGDLRTMADVLGELEKKVSQDINMDFTFKFGDE